MSILSKDTIGANSSWRCPAGKSYCDRRYCQHWRDARYFLGSQQPSNESATQRDLEWLCREVRRLRADVAALQVGSASKPQDHSTPGSLSTRRLSPFRLEAEK
jgi:hypothetical protein